MQGRKQDTNGSPFPFAPIALLIFDGVYSNREQRDGYEVQEFQSHRERVLSAIEFGDDQERS